MFDVKKHLIKVQGGRQYLPVAARLIWFRTEHPDWGIETKAITIDVDKQYAIFESTVYNAEGKLMAKGTKLENVKGFGDWLEKAETGAIGRALAVCGYGTQFAPDLDESQGVTSDEQSYQDRYRTDRSFSRSNTQLVTSAHKPDNLALVAAEEQIAGEHSSDRQTGEREQESSNVCEGCHASLKPSQLSLSLRKFGSALCPDCQQKRKLEQAA